MKYISFIILFLLFFSLKSYAQNPWNFKQEKEGVSIFTKDVFCDVKQGFDRDLILFKIVNSNNNDIQVSFKLNRWVDNVCLNCNSNSNEDYRFYNIQANQTIEGDCDNFRSTNLSLFVKFNDLNYSNTPKVLSNYSIENIQIVD